MFDVGFGELLLCGVVALLVLGPERLPKAARTAGLWMGRLRATVQRFTTEIDRELKAEELRQTLREEARSLVEPVEALHRDVAAAGSELTAAASLKPAAPPESKAAAPGPASGVDHGG